MNKPKKLNKNHKNITINTTKAKGSTSLIQHVIKKNGWKETKDLQADIYWSGLNLNPCNRDLCYLMRVNKFPGLSYLCQKKNTQFVLDKFKSYYPQKFTF